MPFRPDGTFQRNMNWQNDAAADIDILADRHDNEDDNFAAGLSETITKSGKSQPTADIPMNGKRLINLGAPVNNTDAATKAYADAVRNFNTSLTISGNDVQGRLKFTGTGTTGLEFAAADIGFGARVGVAATSWHRFVFNTAADLTGSDVVTITDQGQLGIGQVPPFSAASGVYAVVHTTDQNYALNCYWSNADSKWHFLTAGWAFLISGVKADGTMAIYRSTVSGAANAVITWESLESWAAGRQVTFPNTVYVGPSGSYINHDGNVAGSIWLGYGTGHQDAYSAINARIEARAQAYINNCVQATRMAGVLEYNFTSSGAGPAQEFAGYVMTGMQKTGGDNYWVRWRSPQVYIPTQGWVTAFPF